MNTQVTDQMTKEQIYTEAKVDPVKFRFQNQKVMLTYSTHIEKDDYIDWLTNLTKLKFKFIRMAHETAHEDTPYNHTHVVIDFGKGFQTRNCRFFDYNEIHPHIKPILNKKHWDNSMEYLAKEDIENEDLKKGPSFAKGVWSCESLEQALESCSGPGDVLGTIAMFKSKARTVKPITGTLKRWQEEALSYCQGPVDDRKIRVYYDPSGGMGKTWFIKYMYSNYPGKCHFFTAVNYRDTALAMKNLYDNGWCGDTILINLPRSYESHESMYGIIESMKDGLMTSNKYVSSSFMFDPCHVILMVNFEVRKIAVSLDRWDIIDAGDIIIN